MVHTLVHATVYHELFNLDTHMAGIYKRGNKWGAIFYVNGEKMRATTGIDIIPKDDRTAAQNKKLAQQIADEMERRAKGEASGITIAASLRALADTFDDTPVQTAREYLEAYTPGGKEQNQSGARRAIQLFLKFLTKRKLDSFALSDIKRKHCEEFLGELIQELSEGSVGLYRAHLSTAFNKAVADDIIVKNPFGHLSISSIVNQYSADTKGKDKTERETFTADEMRTILYDFPQPYRDLAAVSYYTGGQRIGDCSMLTWKQVDFKNNTITFCTEKTAKKLTQPLVPELRNRLEALRAASSDPKEQYVFPGLASVRMRSSSTASTRFTDLLRVHGILTDEPAEAKKGRRRTISKKSFHSIRHTVVSIMRAGGVAQDVSRDVVGHDSETVERAYFKASHDSKKAALNLLAKAVIPPGNDAAAT